MKTAVLCARHDPKTMLAHADAQAGHALRLFEDRLTAAAGALAEACPAVRVFVNDNLDADVVAALARQGTRPVATRDRP